MQTALLSGLFALIGVLIAQGIVLSLARKNERRRSDPELLKQCAAFSSAVGRFKRQIATMPREQWDLDCLGELEEAADSIMIIGTPEIEDAVDRLIGFIPMVLNPKRYEGRSDEARQGVFDSHRVFVDSVREYFHKPPKVYKAVPIIRRPQPLGSTPIVTD